MKYTKFRQFEPNKKYVVECIDCHDGDTCTVISNLLGVSTLPMYKWSCRLYGIDCPEMNPKDEPDKTEEDKKKEKECAIKDRDLLSSLILNKKVVLTTHEETDKYGRELVELFDIDTNENINKILTTKGYSVEYFGDKKISWKDRKKIKNIK